MKRTITVLLASIVLLLTGCWSSSEVDERALVHGVGFDFNHERGKLDTYVELVKPTSTGESTFHSDNLVLKLTSDTPLNAAREFIRYAKRRLYFGNSQIWIIGEQLAKEPFVPLFDVIRRDSMNRLNSYIFITKDDIGEIFSTPTLYENLTSDEIASALHQTTFTSDFIPVKLYEFIKLNEERLQTAYLPIINIVENISGKITSIAGTAVIKDNRMIGELTIDETFGLSLLTDNARGGIVTVPKLDEGQIISLEVKEIKTSTTTELDGENLYAKIEVEMRGQLGDNILFESVDIDEKFLREAEQLIEKEISQTIENTLKKLQEFEADISNIGIVTYREYPDQWRDIESIYHEKIFPNSMIDIDVTVDIFHQGLIDRSVNSSDKKPEFPFFK